MLAAFACGSYFLVASILIHILRPDLSLVSEPLSRFAIGDFSIIITMGFFAIGACEVLIGINDKSTRLGSIFIILAGISVIIVALLKTDIGETVTIRGYIHNWSALSEFTWFPVAVFFIAGQMRPGVLKTYSMVTAVVTLGIMVTMVALFDTKTMSFFEAIQKVNIFAITAWLIVYSGSKMAIDNNQK